MECDCQSCRCQPEAPSRWDVYARPESRPDVSEASPPNLHQLLDHVYGSLSLANYLADGIQDGTPSVGNDPDTIDWSLLSLAAHLDMMSRDLTGKLDRLRSKLGNAGIGE